MNVQVEKLEGSMAKLTVTVDEDRFEKAMEQAYKKNKGKIQIQGFRKGKVPRMMIEKLYGPEVFYEDAANDIIPEAYEEALKECEEDIVSEPKIEVTQIEKGSPFIFTAEVALKPEIKLGKYKGIKVTKQDRAVTEEEVEEKIRQELERNARINPVEDRPVKNGDIIKLDFEGFCDGEAFEGGKGEDYSLTIGSKTFIPGFEEKLIGAELNKELDVEVTFPEDYHVPDLAGKPATFRCVVKEIKGKDIPELDQDYVEDVSEFETVEEYRNDIRQ
ncbi:MAG: trigger factor, partial [Lachnospiraceae bacterium]|nr:trigger factor [Lachnospiraceae bacterium]